MIVLYEKIRPICTLPKPKLNISLNAFNYTHVQKSIKKSQIELNKLKEKEKYYSK